MALRYRNAERNIDFNHMIFGITKFEGDAA